MNKLKSILLIDDDDVTNFLHRSLLSELDLAENIIVKNNGLDGLKYIQSLKNGTPYPDMIMVDLKMPVMDGFEFMQEFQKLKASEGKSSKLVALTTSSNPSDIKKIDEIGIDGFMNKPLNKDKVQVIVEEFFEITI
jgi:CheY-like chemotaxis protein